MTKSQPIRHATLLGLLTAIAVVSYTLALGPLTRAESDGMLQRALATPNYDELIGLAHQIKQHANRQEVVNELKVALASSNWNTVFNANVLMAFLPKESIPVLIELLDRADAVPLENTQDLFYPGSKTFSGHGRIVDYDLDEIRVRAGWVLEEITFRDFGFSMTRLHVEQEDENREGQNDRPTKPFLWEHVDREDVSKRIDGAVRNAKVWWKANQGSWNRFVGLLDALSSGNDDRIIAALDWLENGETPSGHLTLTSYQTRIVPEIRMLLKSENADIRNRVRRMLSDGENQWLKWKQPPEQLKD